MKKYTQQLLWLALYAMAMALLEGVAVAYIRGLNHFASDSTQLAPFYVMELWREAATLIMILAVGWVAGQTWVERVAYNFFIFGIWDIGYYIWLRVFTGWPQNLLDWDTLFLLPMTWSGPVLSPVLIAILMCLGSVLLLRQRAMGEHPQYSWQRIGILFLGIFLALYIFMMAPLQAWVNGQSGWREAQPTEFAWLLFIVSLFLLLIPIIQITWPRKAS